MMSRGLGIIDIFSFTISFDFAFLAFVKESTGFLGELGIDEDSFFLGLGLSSEYLDGTGGITTLFDFQNFLLFLKVAYHFQCSNLISPLIV